MSSVFDLSDISHETENIQIQNDRICDKYVGHLKREKMCRTLRQQHFLVADCDKQGNLTKKEIFVQFVGVKSGDKSTYTLLCQGCNDQKEDLRQVLLNTGLCGTTTHMVTYNLLLTYTNDFTKIGSTLRGYLASHNRRLIDQYGADSEELLPFHILKEAAYFFWVNVL